MTLSEIFFGRVEMPARAGERLVEESSEKIRAAIELELARQAREAIELKLARQARAATATDEPEDRPWVRYKTRIPFNFPPELLEPAKKRPPNLWAKELTFSAQLLTFVNAKCDGRSVVAYKRAGVRRNVYSRIVSDDSARADKRTVLQFCIGLQLCRAEADQLLKSAGYALSETIPADIAFAYFIDHSIWNLADINAILAKCGLETINVPE